jgi:hypothetical protein
VVASPVAVAAIQFNFPFTLCQLATAKVLPGILFFSLPQVQLPATATQDIITNHTIMANHAILVILVILAAMANHIMAYRPNLPSSWPPVPTEALEPHDRAHLQFSPRPTDSSVVNDNFRALHNNIVGSSSLSIGTDTCGWWTDLGKRSDMLGGCITMLNTC